MQVKRGLDKQTQVDLYTFRRKGNTSLKTMSKTKRPIRRTNSYVDNYGLDTPQKVILAKMLREIFGVNTHVKTNRQRKVLQKTTQS